MGQVNQCNNSKLKNTLHDDNPRPSYYYEMATVGEFFHINQKQEDKTPAKVNYLKYLNIVGNFIHAVAWCKLNHDHNASIKRRRCTLAQI